MTSPQTAFAFDGVIRTERLEIYFPDPSSLEASQLLAKLFLADNQSFLMFVFGEKAYADDDTPDKVAKDLHESDYTKTFMTYDGGYMKRPREGYFIITKEKKDPIGYFDVYSDLQDRPRLAPFLLPPFRKQGYMAEAYSALRAAFARKSTYFTIAEVEETNTDSVRFYLKQGFTIAARTTDISNPNPLCSNKVHAIMVQDAACAAVQNALEP